MAPFVPAPALNANISQGLEWLSVTSVKSFATQAPGTVFTTLHLLLNLRMGPTSQTITLHYAKKASSDKHSSLLGAFVSYEENEVL
jgi:hypothetical protein